MMAEVLIPTGPDGQLVFQVTIAAAIVAP